MDHELQSSLLLDGKLTTVVAACRAYRVINMELTTVGTYCQCWSNSLVMSSALESTSLGLSSFWMCHNSIKLFNF